APVRGDIEGVELEGVHELRTLEDARGLREAISTDVRRVVVVGGGYIGLEAAEALHHLGREVTVVTSGTHVLERALDQEMGERVVSAMGKMGINVRTGMPIRCLEGSGGRVRSVGCEGEDFPADLVLLGLGTRPEVELAEEAGIPLGETGAIGVDERQRTGVEGVWSAGDCAEAHHRVSGRPANIHLGTVANKAGRVAGINLGGGDATFPGVLGTAITRVCELEVARTGLGLVEAQQAGISAVAEVATGTTTAGYWPQASEMAIMTVVEQGSDRLLGAQIVGGPGAGKRVDVFATALWNGMTAGDLAWVDLAYAPPFSGVWDLIHIAARQGSEAAGN
ncbi:MAG: FAD-dependent oxidoreductase, partial [Acidimicrobiia bacterium]